MKSRHLLILSTGLLLAGNALADEALLRKSGCFACHTVDKEAGGTCAEGYRGEIQGDSRRCCHAGEKSTCRRRRQLGNSADGTGTRHGERRGSQGRHHLHSHPQVSYLPPHLQEPASPKTTGQHNAGLFH